MVKRASNGLANSGFISLIVVMSVFAFNPSFAAQSDPFEPVNRVTYVFNGVLDKFIVRPVAKGYQFVMPEFAERGVRNVFSNLGEVRNVVHNGLQGKLKGSVVSAERFIINSTVGIGGLFDVATKIGLPLEREDLGQTLGKWGVGSGPYLVVPFLGPSSLRDSIGLIADPALSPINYLDISVMEKVGVASLSAIQTRADLIAAEALLTGDKYIIFRQSYLSKREFDVNDGEIKTDDFVDDSIGFDEEDGFLDEGF